MVTLYIASYVKFNQPKCVIDPVGIESLDDNMILVDIQAMHDAEHDYQFVICSETCSI